MLRKIKALKNARKLAKENIKRSIYYSLRTNQKLKHEK